MEKHVQQRTGHRSKVTALVVLGWTSFILSHLFQDAVVTTLLSAIARVLP
jgi:hypothetical protein